MKKLLTLFAMIFIFASTSLYAQSGFYIAPKAQLSYGFGDAHDIGGLTVNPGIGGGILLGYNINQQFSIEFSGSYEYWFTDVDNSPYDYTTTMIPILAGINYSVNNTVGIIAGIGVTFWEFKVEYAGISASEDDSDFSLYIGAEVRIAESVLLRPQLFYVNFEDDPSYQIKLEVAYRFNL